ncbi:DUF3995 domain-containing protein [Aeromicrobium sp. CF3.5]|uniref:DUF3995 domain-containing protein n=1 Tax=Aeromicrobium sp. CF3.5 TaxID=3373078 RepID=UPI003EE4B0C8
MRSPNRAAALAMVLAGASAVVSMWWLCGGTLGLDALGGGLERLARERSVTALAALSMVVVAKLVAVVLAWSMTRSRVSPTLVRLATWGGAALAGYGLLLTAGSAVGLVLDGDGADRTALWWHALLWDPWFAMWGLALMVAGRSAARSPSTIQDDSHRSADYVGD